MTENQRENFHWSSITHTGTLDLFNHVGVCHFYLNSACPGKHRGLGELEISQDRQKNLMNFGFITSDCQHPFKPQNSLKLPQHLGEGRWVSMGGGKIFMHWGKIEGWWVMTVFLLSWVGENPWADVWPQADCFPPWGSGWWINWLLYLLAVQWFPL
jgi:hypothetical protein